MNDFRHDPALRTRRTYGMDGPLHPVQAEAFRRMSVEEKFAVAEDMLLAARALKRAMMKQAHPDWSAERLDREVTAIFAYART